MFEAAEIGHSVSKDDYDRELRAAGAAAIARRAQKRGVSTVVIYEGVDAAGKGGNIRRVTAAAPTVS